MPKKVDVILQINIDKVSCPGVWLCQDGCVALLVFALGVGYQTRFLPPVFPLNFRDTFFFKKQFTDLCTLDNLSCLLRDETIYCELVQTSDYCGSKTKPVVLAQYLGSLSEVLFPPNVCITDGVDLLMKRTNNFPGILAPKIEISTKVRIDQSWNNNQEGVDDGQPTKEQCRCVEGRQHTVCHTPQYHRVKCNRHAPRTTSASRPSREDKKHECHYNMRARSKSPPKSCVPGRPYYPPPYKSNCRVNPCVYNCDVPNIDVSNWKYDSNVAERDDDSSKSQKTTLESRFIAPELPEDSYVKPKPAVYKQKMCTCDICKRYFEMFHRPSSS